MTRVAPRGPTKLRAPKVSSALLPCSLVQPGKAGFDRIDARGLPVQAGQQFPVIGVQLLEDSQVVGVQAFPGGHHLSVEVRPAYRLRLAAGFRAEELFQEEECRPNCAGDCRPPLAGDGARTSTSFH